MLTTFNLLKAIIDNAGEYIVMLSPEHRILVFNKPIEELHKEKMNVQLKVNEDFRQYVHPQNYESYMDIFARGLKGESSVVQREFHMDSGSFWIEYKMKPIYDESGKLFALTLTSSEITDLKLTQSELQHKHDILRAIMDSSTDNIVVLDKDYRVLAINEAAVLYYQRGYNYELKIGDNYLTYLNAENIELLNDTFIKALNGESSLFEMEKEFPDEKIWIEVKVDPVYTLENKLLGVSRWIRNIDKRKKAKLHFRRMRKNSGKFLNQRQFQF